MELKIGSRIDREMPFQLDYVRMVADSSKLTPQIGCTITTRSGYLVSVGYNKLSDNDGRDPSRLNGDEDYILHAEDVAISYLNGDFDHQELVMFIAGKHPCFECAKKIVEVPNIKVVICPPPDTNTKWVQSNHFALAYLEASGIMVLHTTELSREMTDMYNSSRVK